MGQSTWGVLLGFFNLSQPTMKVLFFVALAIAAVCAEPEAEPKADADPEAWYGHYYGWPGYYGGWGGYYGHPYRYGYRLLGKRSADAEPKADAEPEADADATAWYYGGYYGHPGYYGYGYGLGYRGYYSGYYGYPYTYGHYLGKRSADAEPEGKAEAEPWYYGYGGYYGYPYRSYYGYARPYYGRYWWYSTILAILKPSCLNLPNFILPLSFPQTINYCPQNTKIPNFFFKREKKKSTNVRFGHKEFFCFLIWECAKYQHHTAHRL